MKYKCRRCHYFCTRKDDMRRHFNRKRKCKVIFENIDIDTLKKI